jgi:tRNA(Ser,Leu) C12 N-acetylase TAN1
MKSEFNQVDVEQWSYSKRARLLSIVGAVREVVSESLSRRTLRGRVPRRKRAKFNVSRIEIEPKLGPGKIYN